MLRKIIACPRASVPGAGPVAVVCAMALAAASVFASSASAQTIADQVGLTALIQRVGAGNQPTGAGVGVGQVEADEDGVNGAPYSAYPNTADSQFVGKTFTAMSGAINASNHATFVGAYLYGSNAIAPGIPNIYMYEVNSWLQGGYLLFGGGPPGPPPGILRIFNSSWIGSAGTANDIQLLRRADYAADQYDILFVSGVNNGPGANQPLMAYMYDGLSVGLVGGGHTSSVVPAGLDGPGRSKPEIVAPNTLTSFATPIVSAAASLMYQTAQTGAGLSGNLNARKSETIKAVLLAGANHGADGLHAWSNNPATSGANRGVTATPLDPIWGADLVNVDRSHRILTGLEQNGSATVPTSPNVTAAGWDFASVNTGNALNYRFRISSAVDKVSIVATWHRAVTTNFALAPLLANFDLTLKRIDNTGAAVTLVGNPGVGVFGGGNVVSQSTIDNIEHLYVTNLVAGDYVIELRRQADTAPNPTEVALAWIVPNTLRPGDVNGDGLVNVTDLLAVISAWGPCPVPANCPADVTHDGVVNVADLLMVISNWG